MSNVADLRKCAEHTDAMQEKKAKVTRTVALAIANARIIAGGGKFNPKALEILPSQLICSLQTEAESVVSLLEKTYMFDARFLIER